MSNFKASTTSVLVPTISCHAWNADRSRVAVCPNDSNIYIYKTNNSEDFQKWEVEHQLTEHDHLVTAIDWAPKTNRILSCSQDRNAYVWTYDNNDKKWVPELVLLRINRAATCCKWSPKENKFAVGSGAKLIGVCVYEDENKWWVSKMIKKPIKSTVLSVKWHPTDNSLLLCGSSDFKCRLFSAFIKKADEGKEVNKFGTCIAEYNAKGWVHDVEFSPSGNVVAYIGHDSTVTFVDRANGDKTTVVTIPELPLRTGIFLSENAFVAGGYDYTPLAFSNNGGEWKLNGKCDLAPQEKAATGGNVRSMFMKFQQVSTVTATTRHHNVINSILPYKSSGNNVTVFSTSALDGKVLTWQVSDLEKGLEGFKV
ncbi:actin-related protein 2/3 complex subunit 1 [Acrasis kona]|uniref:Actin-related protein 2/3 complex subunit n=1 Tax=Acrasis kona TaxID=1008807 RepID=A0AAW2Z7Q1_9EUKA